MARTTKPCPGCGEVDHYRPADRVCETCKGKLKRVAEIEAEAVALRAIVAATISAETHPHALFIAEKGYGILHNNRLADSDQYHAFRDATLVMFQALLAPLARGRVDQWRNHGTIPDRSEYFRQDDATGHVETTKEGAKAACDWWRAFKTFAQHCYGAGIDDGRDLLGQLAAGEMTVGQVNDRAYEIVERKRR